jgi:hypothetical protein
MQEIAKKKRSLVLKAYRKKTSRKHKVFTEKLFKG